MGGIEKRKKTAKLSAAIALWVLTVLFKASFIEGDLLHGLMRMSLACSFVSVFRRPFDMLWP